MPDSTKRPLKVFLCHASADKSIVRELYRQLTSEGWIDVWLDEEKLLPGQEWDIEIEKAVEESDIVIACLSNRSVDKEGYVQKELRFVLNIADEKPEGSIFVIPLRLDDCVVPRRLRHWQWVDYFPKYQQKLAYQRILQSLKERARKPSFTPLPTPAATAPPVVNTAVKTTASHTQFGPPEVAEKPGSRLEESAPVLREETKEEKPAARLPSAVTALKVRVKKHLPKLNFRLFGVAGAILITLVLGILSIEYLIASKSPEYTIGSTMIGNDGMTLLYVPAGQFIMGDDNSKTCDGAEPLHKAVLNSFWIDKTEVTNAMYAKCVNAAVCYAPNSSRSSTRDSYYGNSEFDNYPVVFVDWNQAKAYCKWVGRRLPTEAEWEKAARGTDGLIYPWGNATPNNDLLNYNDAVGDTTPVGNYPHGASPYGAVDMAGNVLEWVADWASFGNTRAVRGSNWASGNSTVCSARRDGNGPSKPFAFIGFRCATSATP